VPNDNMTYVKWKLHSELYHILHIIFIL